ncbi:MAG: DUF3244 domain-containing protein [Bacteroidales bacterium]|nr:DUF3244 domain-containing protein [Bacteroidales bacterium]
MKNLFRIFLLVSVVFIPIFGYTSTYNDNDQTKEIDLEGTLFDVTIESLLPDPVHANINSYDLNADFVSNLGVLSVEIYATSSGLVYQKNVNTQTQQSLSINVADWDSGIYEIRFVNAAGNYMYGTFEIGL